MNAYWHRLAASDPDERPWLVDAFDAFEPPDPSRDADQTVVSWLRHKAFAECDKLGVWVLIDGGAVRCFHTEEPGQVLLPGARRPSSSLHVSFAGRSRDAADGGAALVSHLDALAAAEGIHVVTADPFDEATVRPWLMLGFQRSETLAQEDPTWSVPRVFRRPSA